MELCDASLDQCVGILGNQLAINVIKPTHGDFFFQLISGLDFIHSSGFVHGSIKPSNILLSFGPPPQIKLSDFCLVKPSFLNTTKLLHSPSSKIDGGIFWIAPEFFNGGSNILLEPTKLGDIFAAGCVAFYYFSGGHHLFGDQSRSILQNIKQGNQANLLTRMHSYTLIIFIY